jgi:hypothetical protein
MDEAFQSMVESSLGMVEREWEERYKILDEWLSNLTDWAVSLKAERDKVLSQAEEALASSTQLEREGEDYELLENQRACLREEFTAELTDSLTDRHYLPLAISLLVSSM